MFDKFSERHIGVSNEKDLKAMLDVIGVKSVDELISQVIPQSIRLRKPLALPAEGMSEYEFAAHIRELADRNQPYRSFIGMGYYPSAVPAVVTRNVFENPAWYTSYTPYQAEISQGRLEALLNFQTAVISLTGMEIGNCSLLDEGTAAAEAMAMMFSLRSRDAVREGRNRTLRRPQHLPADARRAAHAQRAVRHRTDRRRLRRIRIHGPGVRRHRAVPGRRRPGARLLGLHGCGARQGRARNGRRRPAVAGAPESPGRVGRRHRRGFGAAPRHADGLRRSRRGLHDHARGVQAQHAGPHHRRLGRPAGQQGAAHGACRCANSTSSASAPPRTSAPPRP